MPKFVIKDADVTIDAVNLSDHVASVEISSSKDVQEATGMGAAMKEKLLGLGDGTITLNMQQDFDAASVDATLWPIHLDGDPVPVVVKPKSGAVSATNPSYTMQGVLPSFSPLAGSVGEVSTTEVAFQNADQSGIVRAIV